MVSSTTERLISVKGFFRGSIAVKLFKKLYKTVLDDHNEVSIRILKCILFRKL